MADIGRITRHGLAQKSKSRALAIGAPSATLAVIAIALWHAKMKDSSSSLYFPKILPLKHFKKADGALPGHVDVTFPTFSLADPSPGSRPPAMSETFDYIVAGGGSSGCVVASRLAEAFTDLSIALIEAGQDVRHDPDVEDPAKGWLLGDDYKRTFMSTPQAQLNNRQTPLQVGKALGGGSGVNYGGWTRGDRSGYAEWAKLVGDDRWSYDGLLPYFKKAETYPCSGLDAQHGYSGPIMPSAGDRGYPLKELLRKALLEAGIPYNEDQNGGRSVGFGRLFESWSPAGKRSHAANRYKLDKVKLLVNASVAKLLIENSCAVGVKLQDGRELRAKREVILSTGAIITPQLLMLSGIGPMSELAKFDIPLVVDLPAVGQNLWDHASCCIYRKLRDPDKGLAVGSGNFSSRPEYFAGNQMDWLTIWNAGGVDGSRRDNIELTINYISTPLSEGAPPVDGTHITTGVAILDPSSRGTVSVKSADPAEPPLMDPRCLSTGRDMAVLRAGVRLSRKIMETEAAQEYRSGETPPPGARRLNEKTTEAELHERIRAGLASFYHPAGTASMGRVVDGECRVKGVNGLRVVDASIIPVPIGAHLQAVMHGVAESAAALIIESGNESG